MWKPWEAGLVAPTRTRLTPRSGVFMSSAKWEGVRGDLTSVVCSHLYVSWAVMECTVYLSTSRGGK